MSRPHALPVACGTLSLLHVTGCTEELDREQPRLATRGDDCVSCHTDEASSTGNPSHLQAGFGDDCAQCHDEQQWRPAAGFVHALAFPLTRGHDGVDCASCHAGAASFAAAVNDCAVCHAQAAARVVDPIHDGLSKSCFACHRTDSFAPAQFIHSWPLAGIHALTSCRSCHGQAPARYEGLSATCSSCHADDYARAVENSPAHGGYPTSCNDCHGFTSFRDRQGME